MENWIHSKFYGTYRCFYHHSSLPQFAACLSCLAMPLLAFVAWPPLVAAAQGCCCSTASPATFKGQSTAQSCEGAACALDTWLFHLAQRCKMDGNDGNDGNDG